MTHDHEPAQPANGHALYSVPPCGTGPANAPLSPQAPAGFLAPVPALWLPTLRDRPAVSWNGLNHNRHGLVRFGTESYTNRNAKWYPKAVRSVDDSDLVSGVGFNVAVQVKSVRLLSRDLCVELYPLARRSVPNAKQLARLCPEEYRDLYLTPEEHTREQELWSRCEFASPGAADLDHSNVAYMLTCPSGEVVLLVSTDEAKSLAFDAAKRLWSCLAARDVFLSLWLSSGPQGVGIHGHFGPVEETAWSPHLPRAVRALLIDCGQAAGVHTLQGAPEALRSITAALNNRFGPEAFAVRREKKVCLHVPVPLSRSDALAWLRWAQGCLPPVLLDLSPVSASPRARGNMLRTQWGKTKDGTARKCPIPDFDAPASPLTRDLLLPYLERARLQHQGRAAGLEPRGSPMSGQAGIEIATAGRDVSRVRAGPLTEAILSRIDVPGVMTLLGLEPIQRGHRGRCPLHAGDPTQASFKVTHDGQLWCCYSPNCEPRQGHVARGGNAIWLAAYHTGKSYLEARAWLTSQLGLSLEPGSPDPRSCSAVEESGVEPTTPLEPGLEPEQRRRAGQLIVEALRTGADCERLRLVGLHEEHAALLADGQSALAAVDIAAAQVRKASRQGGVRAATIAETIRAEAERKLAGLRPMIRAAYELSDTAKRSAKRVFAFATCRQYKYCRRYACGSLDTEKDRRPLSCDHPLCRGCVGARDAGAKSARQALWPEILTVVRVPCGDAGDCLLPSKKEVQRLRNRWARRTRASRLLTVPRSPLAVVVPGALVLFLEGDCAAVARSIGGTITQVDVQILTRSAALSALEAALYLPAEQLEEVIRQGLRRIDDADAQAQAKEQVMREEVQAWIKILRDRRELDGNRRRVLTGKNALELAPSRTADDEFGSGEVPVGVLGSLEPRLPCCPAHGPGCKITDYVVTDALGRLPARRLPGLARAPQAHEIETQAHWLTFNSAVVEHQDPTADEQAQPTRAQTANPQDQPAPVHQQVTDAVVAAHEPAWVGDDADRAPPNPPASLLGAPDWVLETYEERAAIVAERGGLDLEAKCIAEQEALRLWRKQSLELFPGALGTGACGEPTWN